MRYDGIGTAIAFAQNGYNVNMYGRKDASIERATKNINFTLNVMVENNLLTEVGAKEVLSRIHGVTTLKDAAHNADFVIESVAEELSIKQSVYKEMEEYLGEDVIFATDSSGLSPTAVAAALKHPERFCCRSLLESASLNSLG